MGVDEAADVCGDGMTAQRRASALPWGSDANEAVLPATRGTTTHARGSLPRRGSRSFLQTGKALMLSGTALGWILSETTLVARALKRRRNGGGPGKPHDRFGHWPWCGGGPSEPCRWARVNATSVSRASGADPTGPRVPRALAPRCRWDGGDPVQSSESMPPARP